MTVSKTVEVGHVDVVKLAAQARDQLTLAERFAGDLREALGAHESRTREIVADALRRERVSGFDVQSGDFLAFLEEPYCVVAAGADKWRVIAPRWVDFHIGVLERTTPSFNVFLVDRFARWLGHVPPELEQAFQFKPSLSAVVDEGVVHVDSERDQEEVWERYRKHLTRREGKNRIRVAEGHEFKLIARLIDDGTLPFRPHPVSPEDLRSTPEWSGVHDGEIQLRGYQRAAWEKFLETGAVGVYWPTGAGKTYPPLYAFANLKGRHLVVVPNRTLVEQWTERLRKHLSPVARGNVDVVTYQAYDRVKRQLQNRSDSLTGYTLVVFEECHHLPANQFSKWATVPMKYRMGLSATPYREDGRTDYIFALTGYPIGLDWRSIVDEGLLKVPEVHLYVCDSWQEKEAQTRALLASGRRAVVFCDGLDRGAELARRLGLEFVSGATRNRLDVLRANEQAVVSRVGDEGLSLQDLELVVEVDFHGGSRRQEGQRMGRLMHATETGEHWILMTREELRHEKRLLAIQEKGIRIRVHDAGSGAGGTGRA